jgi:bromodomain-containing factor 1
MDFGAIRTKLNQNLYMKMEDFIRDINLVFDNCFLYNGEQSFVSNLCKAVKEEF